MEKFFNRCLNTFAHIADKVARFVLGEPKAPPDLPKDTFVTQKHRGIYFFLSYERHRDMLFELKRARESLWIRPLSDHLSIGLVDILHRAKIEGTDDVLLVPVPLSRRRLLRRGFNQSRVLLNNAAKRIDNAEHFVVEAGNLVKVRETPKQAALSRKARLTSQSGAFALRKPDRVRGRSIILFDDISTTGATLKEAQQTLEKAGAARVICVSLAH